MSHTQGPWSYDGRQYVFGPKSEMVGEVRGCGGGLPMDDNGRLLAGAPELLESLEEALDVIGSWGEDGDPEWARRARDLIAKIKGTDYDLVA